MDKRSIKGLGLSSDAQNDLWDIWVYTKEEWGVEQAERYLDKLIEKMVAVNDGSTFLRLVDGAAKDIRFCRAEHHYIFVQGYEAGDLKIFAILHERMDIPAQVRGRLS